MTSPATVVHADWSKSPRKRWVAVASRGVRGQWLARGPVRATAGTDLLAAVHADDAPRPVVIGFDFPIGIPHAYAAAADIASFPHWLTGLGAGV